MIYDKYTEPDNGGGACIPTARLNELLAPYNLEAHEGGSYVSVTPKDNDLPFPTNWEEVADHVTCFGEPCTGAKLGRKKWKVPEPEILRDAVISPCGKYRYVLTRSWGPGARLVFLMMNPSTADAELDDATIRKCMGFARRWNYDGIVVVNLFALRSRDPEALCVPGTHSIDPINFNFVCRMLEGQGVALCAWGCESTLKKGKLLPGVTQFMNALRGARPLVRFMCFGLTKGGTPRHPLMLPYTTATEDYWP